MFATIQPASAYKITVEKNTDLPLDDQGHILRVVLAVPDESRDIVNASDATERDVQILPKNTEMAILFTKHNHIIDCTPDNVLLNPIRATASLQGEEYRFTVSSMNALKKLVREVKETGISLIDETSSFEQAKKIFAERDEAVGKASAADDNSPAKNGHGIAYWDIQERFKFRPKNNRKFGK